MDMAIGNAYLMYLVSPSEGINYRIPEMEMGKGTLIIWRNSVVQLLKEQIL